LQRFTEIKVWQRSHQLVLDIYRISKEFPEDERFGLTSQLRRAAVSVPCNIAEGSKRVTGQDYARFLNIAQGSVAEVQYLLILGGDLGYLNAESAKSLLGEAEEIGAMLNSLRMQVQRSKA
jgi:four helix bundle protein